MKKIEENFEEKKAYTKSVSNECASKGCKNSVYTVRKSGYNLKDTLECGQCFRHEEVIRDDGCKEYIIPIGQDLISVAQREVGELIFTPLYDAENFEKLFDEVISPYFTLDRDYAAIAADIKERSNNEWLSNAADSADGIAILAQDPWEALFSFIISQNNNIPRIRKIIRELSVAYGVNISLQKGLSRCPANKIDTTPCEEKCKSCGICYSFPKPDDVANEPEKMQPSHPGFRYRYLLDAAERVVDGRCDLDDIKAHASYSYTVTELKKITGVGDKVAACCALFGFGNLEAFPIDVWMKRAIDTYFDGRLDPTELGPYAGIAQQYIFHYIRNIEN